MATSMPTATADVSDVANLGLAAIAALAARDSSPRKSSRGSPPHSRTHSYSRTYPQSSSHSHPQSQSESYHPSQHHLQRQQQQQQIPSRSPPSRSKDIAEDSINAYGVFSPPPFAHDQPTSASHDYYQQQQQQREQQRNRRSSSPSAARTIPKMAAARRPLPSAAFNGSAVASNASHSKPSSRRPSASSASSILSATHRGRMAEANSNGRDASLAAKTGRGAADSTGLTDALRDEIIVGSSNSLRASPQNIASGREDTAMTDSDLSALLPQPKRRRSTATNSEAGEEQTDLGPVANKALSPRVHPPNSSQQTHQVGSSTVSNYNSTPATQGPATAAPNNKIEIPLGYWRESTVPEVKDRHAIVGFIDTMDRLRTRIVQTTRFGAPIALDYEHPSGTGSSWVTFERVVFENHLIGLDHNQVKEYVKIRSEMAGVPETPEQRTINEKNAVKDAMWRASAQPASDTHLTPQIAYGVDLPDFAMHANGGRPEKKRRVTNSYGPALSPQNDANTKPTPPPTGNPTGNPTAHNGTNGEFPPVRSPSVFSAIQRSAIDLLPGTRPAKILVGYWRGSSEERIEDKHAVLGILGANDMFRVKVTRQTRDGRPVLGNFPVGAGALWINYDEVEFEQHIRHLSRPEMKEYVRVRQRQLDEGEEPHQRLANEPTAVFEAQARVLKAGGAAQSTLGNSGRVDTISFATAVRLDREAARVAEMNEANKTHDNAERNGAPHDGRNEAFQRRGSSGHEVRHSRRSTMDQQEDAASIAAAAVATSSGTGRAAGRLSISDAANRNDLLSNPTAERIERTNDIARREISRIESLQQRNEQREGVNSNLNANENSVGSANGNGNGNSAAPFVPSQTANGSANGANAGDSTENSNRQTFNENINRLNRVWAAQEASRLRADGEDAKIFRGVKYERKQNGPFQGKLVSPGTILSIDGEDYVEYRVLTKPSFF